MQIRPLFTRYLPLTLALLGLIAGGVVYFIVTSNQKVEAAWYSPAWTYRKAVTIDKNKVVLSSSTVTTTFTTTGGTSWVVPAGVTSITVKAWGAGGGGGGQGGSGVAGGAGGGGAYVTSVISVTPGETLTMDVGGGGGGATAGCLASGGGGAQGASATGKGGKGGDMIVNCSGPGGGGGGGTFIRRGATILAVAGGGGGGGGTEATGGPGAGGAGGVNGANSTGGCNATGGTAGGNATTTGATGLVSGSDASAGGGGGGGLLGGGGGGFPSCDSVGAAGGGGGTSSGDSTINGSGTTPGNNSDPSYTGSVGVGGASQTAGNNGYIVVTYANGHANFPMLFSVTDPDLKFTGSGGKVGISSGTDMLFTSGDGVTKLDHEIEKYSSTTGETVIWVEIPTLTATADTTLYLYFGNAAASDQQNVVGTWDSSYAGVWHLKENAGSTTVADSTSNANTGTNVANTNNKTVTGKINGGLDYNGSSDYTTVTDHSSLDITTNGTFSAWFNADTWTAGNDQTIIKKDGNYILRKNASAQPPGDNLTFLWFDNTNLTYLTTPRPSTGGWHLLTAVVTANAPTALYMNGELVKNSASTWFGTSRILTNNLGIGGQPGGGEYIDAKLDEIRVLNTARSAEWIKTEYNNQSSPGSFYAYGKTEIQRTNLTSYTSGAGANWYSSSWSYRKAITIDKNKLSTTATTTFSNFPLLFSVIDPELKFTGSGGKMASSTGGDLLFTASDGTTKLDFETEKYASTTGETIAWVRIPTLSAAADTTIYIYFGNASATNQQNATGVWDTNYKAVYHLKNGTVLSATDSTSNANNGSAVTPTASTGKVDGAASFNGTTDRIDLTRTSSLSQTTAWTIQAWTYANSAPNGVGVISERYGITDVDVQYEIGYAMDETGANYNLKVGFFDGTWRLASDVGNVALKQWVHIVGSWDGTNLRLYKNGVLVASSAPGGTVPTGTDQFFIGRRHDTAGSVNFFPGLIDEARISGIVRSADWVKTEYNNQSAPGAFYAYGQVELQTRARAGVAATTTPYSTLWYESSFTKRRGIVVSSGASSTTATNYQVPVTVTYDSDMQADFDDIRFTDSANTVLDYWLERKTNSSSAIFWVEIPTLPTNGTTLNMYYGSSTAATLTNLDNTFRNNSIYLETHDCIDTANCSTDSHTEFENIITANYPLRGSGYRTAVNDASDPYSANQDAYFMRYRFLLEADTTGTWEFASDSDDASEVNLRSNADTASTTVLATWYGPHGSGACGSFGTPGSRSLTTGDVIFVEYRQTEIAGGAAATMCVKKPGGSYQTVNTTNFSGLLYARELSPSGVEPVAVVSSNEERYGATAPMSWYSSSWGYRKAIIIDRTKVSGNLTNFPMLFSVTDPDLKFTSSGGKVGVSSGNDILFTLEDGVTKLDHELETYIPTTGETAAWVRLPQLSSQVETTIYIYFGNSGASSQQNATGVWDSNYKGVWHVASSTALSTTDSTTNAYNGTATGVSVEAGKIGGAAKFTGGTQNVSFGDVSDFDFGINDFTVSYWAKNASSTPHASMYTMTKYQNPAVCGNTGFFSANINSSNYFGFQIDELGVDFNGFATTVDVGKNTWNYYTVVRSGRLMSQYVNGKFNVSSTTLDTTLVTTNGAYIWGQSPCMPTNLEGSLDEVRISNGAARSADWIATEYRNQSSPSSFYGYGALSTSGRKDASGTSVPPTKVRGGVKFR